MKRIIFIWLCFMPIIVSAQDFVYTPVNPAFGGNTYNYSWLLNSADAQKKQATATSAASSQNTLDNFTSNLNNQILNQLASKILQEQFGSNFSLQNGQYTVGNYQINITQGTQGVDINILDTQSGGQSSITIPNQ